MFVGIDALFPFLLGAAQSALLPNMVMPLMKGCMPFSRAHNGLQSSLKRFNLLNKDIKAPFVSHSGVLHELGQNAYVVVTYPFRWCYR